MIRWEILNLEMLHASKLTTEWQYTRKYYRMQVSLSPKNGTSQLEKINTICLYLKMEYGWRFKQSEIFDKCAYIVWETFFFSSIVVCYWIKFRSIEFRLNTIFFRKHQMTKIRNKTHDLSIKHSQVFSLQSNVTCFFFTSSISNVCQLAFQHRIEWKERKREIEKKWTLWITSLAF